ncbi:MAG: chaperone NapD [Calditerrivibrio sp.]|nr:chaperone NapD [Calditerrivibrio sp.]MCA1980805.1 chaperone NapD [Calditerrivibrio sp.]
MIFTGSLVTFAEGKSKDVVEFLSNYPQIDVYTVSEEKRSIVITIESDSEESLEELCKELMNHDDIINIGHHYFNFEEEVEKINKGEVTNISLKGFSKSEQRKLRDTKYEY